MVARNFKAVPGVDNESLLVTQSGAGAIQRTVENKVRDIVSVKDFGAVGNGIADDTAEIQAALVYASSLAGTGGCEVYFPAGTYLVTSTLNVVTNTKLSGGGAATLTRSTDYGDTLNFNNVFNCEVEGLYLINTGSMTSGAHINCSAGNFINIERCILRDGFYGIYLTAANTVKVEACVIDATSSRGSGSAAVFMKQNGAALKPSCTLSNTNIVCGTPSGGSIIGYWDYGIVAEEVDGLKIQACYVMGSAVANFKFSSSTAGGYAANIDVTNTMSDHCKGDSILFSGTNNVASFRWNGGKISGLDLGDANKNGLNIQSPCYNIYFNAEFEGFKGSAISVNNANANLLNFSDCQFTKATSSVYNLPQLHILQGSEIVVSNSIFEGQSKSNWAVVVNSGVSSVNISDVRCVDHTTGSVYLHNGSQNVTISDCVLANTAVLNSGCVNATSANSLSPGSYSIVTNNALGFFQDSSGRIFTGGASGVAAIEAGTSSGKVFKRGHECSCGVTTTGTAYHFSFANPNGFVGSISTDGASTAYNVASDYRLKENVLPLSDSLSRVLKLKPCRFNFKSDPFKEVDGFLAHEVQEVVPEAVTETKDAQDAQGNPIYQGMDQAKLVPLLTAAVQELYHELDFLKQDKL